MIEAEKVRPLADYLLINYAGFRQIIPYKSLKINKTPLTFNQRVTGSIPVVLTIFLMT